MGAGASIPDSINMPAAQVAGAAMTNCIDICPIDVRRYSKVCGICVAPTITGTISGILANCNAFESPKAMRAPPSSSSTITVQSGRIVLDKSTNEEELMKNSELLLNHYGYKSTERLKSPAIFLLINKLLKYHEINGKRFSQHERSMLLDKAYAWVEAHADQREQSAPQEISPDEFYYLLFSCL